jgi:hypothetical protein
MTEKEASKVSTVRKIHQSSEGMIFQRSKLFKEELNKEYLAIRVLVHRQYGKLIEILV